MNWTVFIIECIIMLAAFLVMVSAMELANPVSFISDYPPEIQKRYYESQHKQAEKQKLTKLMLIKKIVALIVFAFLFAWMAHIAGAQTFLQGLLTVYAYVIILAAFDTFFIDWVLFPNIKRMRLPGTEDMDKEYHQKWFHVKAMFPMVPVFAVGGFVMAGLMILIW